MTTTDAEIRAWAKEAGVDCPTRGMVPGAVREQYAAAHPAADNPGLSGDEPAPEHGYAEAEAAPTRPQAANDVAPVPPAGFVSKLRGRGGPAAPKTPHKRVSLESMAAGFWSILGSAAKNRGLIPTGRAMELQAPVAGMILDDALRGTVVDRIAQPLARGGESMRAIGALVGVPALVTAATVRPDLQEVIVPRLRTMMREWAIVAGPLIKAREKREKRAMEQLGVDADGLDALVDEWIAGMFAPLPDMPPAEGAPGA